MIRAYQLGYAKTLGSCGPKLVEDKAQAVCRKRQREVEGLAPDLGNTLQAPDRPANSPSDRTLTPSAPRRLRDASLRDAMLSESTQPEFRGRVFGFHRAGDNGTD